MKESSFKTIKSQYRVMTALALVLAALSSFSLQANATTGETIIGPANEAGPGRVDPPQTQARDFSGLVTQYNRSTDSQKTNLLNANRGLDRVLINSSTSGTAQATTGGTQRAATQPASSPVARPPGADGATNTVTQPAATNPYANGIVMGGGYQRAADNWIAQNGARINLDENLEAQIAAISSGSGSGATGTEESAGVAPQIAAGAPEATYARAVEDTNIKNAQQTASGGGSSSSGGGLGGIVSGASSLLGSGGKGASGAGGGFLSGIGQMASGGSTLAGMAGTFCSLTNNRNCVNSIGKAVAQVGMANQFAQAIPRIPGAATNAVNRLGAMGTGFVNQARTAGSQISNGARSAGAALNNSNPNKTTLVIAPRNGTIPAVNAPPLTPVNIPRI